MKSAPAIVFDYVPSRWLIAAVWIVLVTGLFALAACAMPLWIKVAVAVVACAYAAHDLYRFGHCGVLRAAWYEAGHWRLSASSDTERLAELQTGIVRGNWVVLRLRGNDGQVVALILGPDNSDADLRRRLRVRLARVRDETQ